MVDKNVVKLISLSKAISFMKKTGEHNQRIQFSVANGPYEFFSIKTLEGFNGFRSEDLESLGYCFMYLIDNERVPWRDSGYDLKQTLSLKKEFLAQADPYP